MSALSSLQPGVVGDVWSILLSLATHSSCCEFDLRVFQYGCSRLTFDVSTNNPHHFPALQLGSAARLVLSRH